MRNNKGFSLIELSIVITILGLMITGVVGGTSLVNSARINIICSEIEAYKKAFIEYYDKYEVIAGKNTTSSKYSTTAWNTLVDSKLIKDGSFDGTDMISKSRKTKYLWITNSDTNKAFTDFSKNAIILEAQSNKVSGRDTLTFENITNIITKSDDGSLTTGTMRSDCTADTKANSTACKLFVMVGEFR